MSAKATKPSASKSHTARAAGRSNLLKRKVKFDWRIAVVIGILLVAALGYLFVRLSSASTVTLANYGTVTMAQNGASPGTKTNGTRYLMGPGAPILRIWSTYAGYPRGGKASQFEVTYFSTTGGSGNGAVVAQACGKNIASSGTVGVANGSRVSVKVTNEMIIANCGSETELQLVTFVPANVYITGMQVYDVTGVCGGYQTIGEGATGSCVSLIQKRLTDLRYNPGPIDGRYGSQTTSAVRLFQQKAGLPQDGIVGPQTWGVLSSSNAPMKY